MLICCKEQVGVDKKMRICDSTGVAVPVYIWSGTGTSAPRFFGATAGSYSDDRDGVSLIVRGMPLAGSATSDGRSGDIVKYRSMRYRFRVYRTFTNNTNYYVDQVRVVIYMDMQWSINSRLDRADLFGTRLGNVSLMDPLNPNLAGRIIILRDIFLFFSPVGNLGADTGYTCMSTNSDDIFCDGEIDLSPFYGKFLNAAGAASSGNIQGVVCCQAGTAAVPTLRLDYFFRLIYEEM